MRRFLLIVLACLALAACDRPAPNPGAKVYLVGTDASYPPFESQNEKGEFEGFDIDIVNAIAKNAGITVKFVYTPWEGIFGALAHGDRDLLVASITITDERKKAVDFTDPYFNAHQLIAVRAGSPVARFDDLKGLKVGVQTGTTGDVVVTKLQGRNSANIKRFDSTPLALSELESGGVDAVVADNGVVIHYLSHHARARFNAVNDPAFAPEQYGIAVKKGNTALLGKLNRGLAAIKADGTYDRIVAKYFAAAASAPLSQR